MLFPVDPTTGSIDFTTTYKMPSPGTIIYHQFYNDMVDSLIYWALWFQGQFGLAQQLQTNSYNGLNIVQQYPQYFPKTVQSLSYAYYGEEITTTILNQLIRATEDVYKLKKNNLDSFKQAFANYLKTQIIPNIHTLPVIVLPNTVLISASPSPRVVFLPQSGTQLILTQFNKPYTLNFLTTKEAKATGSPHQLYPPFLIINSTSVFQMPYVPLSALQPAKNQYLTMNFDLTFSCYASPTNYTVVTYSFPFTLKVFLGNGYYLNSPLLYTSPPTYAYLIGAIKFSFLTMNIGGADYAFNIDLGGLHTKHKYYIIQSSETTRADFWMRLIENVANLAGGIMALYQFFTVG